MGLYIQMHSMHGLFRSQNLELGRDEDTGGQIVYVLELAKALAKLKKVDEVEIFTRRIIDEEYPGYSEAIEKINKKVRIVRIECGPRKYIKKVKLWPHLKEFIKNTEKYIQKKGRVPDVFQSNYADSGLVCARLSQKYGKPQLHTGHSLGIPKMQRLGVSKKNFLEYNRRFNFRKRLKAEQAAIDNSSIIVGSTKEEITQQYSGYKLKDKGKFRSIPPGVDLERFYPPKLKPSKKDKYIYDLMENAVDQELEDPKERVFSILSRLDKRKNIHGLIRAFGKDKELQRMANLIVFANTLSPDAGTKKIVKEINKLIRKYDLYDQVGLPGVHLDFQTQVPAYYRWLAKKKGVFVNPALIEPFGITVLEASACGVPVIATKYGGPSEIITHGENGLLIDVKDDEDIAKQLKKIFKDKKLYNKISKNAAKNIKQNYSWKSAAKKYYQAFEEIT